MTKKNIISLAVITLMFSSCQVKVGEVEAASEAPSIDGIWSTDCMVDGTDSYIKSINVVSGAMTQATIRYTSDTLCDPSARAATIMHFGTMTISGDHSSIVGAKNYELQLSAAVLVPESADIVTMLNTNSACGSNAWVLNEAAMIFGCAVGGGFDFTLTLPATVDYGVFYIEGAATPNYLQFGTACAQPGYNGMCPAPADRPSTISGDVYFRR